MAYQEVGTGASANDGTGDDLRTGAGKINANIVEVYAKINGVATSAITDGTAITTDSVVLATATQTLTNKTITGTLTGNVTGNVSTSSGNLQLDAATQIVEVRGDGASTEGQIILNCETNAHGQTIKPQPHSAAVTNEMMLPAGASSTLVSLVSADTLTNKSVDLANNTLTGTTAEFNTALSDGDFATIAGTETLTNKTLTAPTITGAGAIAGVFTGNITGDVTGNVTGDVTGNLTGNVTGNVDGQVTLSEASLTGDGSTTLVVDPTVGITLITSSAGAETASLADASVVGTTINIILEVDGGGDVVLTPTTFLNGASITFADAGDQVTLVWTGTNGWAMIGAGFGAPQIT